MSQFPFSLELKSQLRDSQGVRWVQHHFFAATCLFELSLLFVSYLGSFWLKSPWWNNISLSMESIVWACGGSLFLFGLFLWSLRLDWPSLVRIKVFLEDVAGPYFRQLAVWQLAVISLIAGVAEEALFRGTIQRYAMAEWGWLLGWVIGSVIFGLFHWVTMAYAVLASGIGLYLGWVYWASNNLLVPMMIHAIYDFAVLTYYYCWKRST